MTARERAGPGIILGVCIVSSTILLAVLLADYVASLVWLRWWITAVWALLLVLVAVRTLWPRRRKTDYPYGVCDVCPEPATVTIRRWRVPLTGNVVQRWWARHHALVLRACTAHIKPVVDGAKDAIRLRLNGDGTTTSNT